MKIGSILGIQIRVDPSWLFVFALVAWTLSSSLGPFASITTGGGERLLLGSVSALLFFGSVLAHELAHSLVARSRGIPIAGITLFIFGGVSQFEREPSTAPSAAWIALVGPLTSLALGALFFLASQAVGPTRAFGEVVGYLAFANIALGVFNLLPAYPLDGGRVLHAILWSRFKDRMRATRAAVGVGRVLAGIMIAYGIYSTLAFGFGSGLWITFIGWYILQAGRAEVFQTEVAVALSGHSAAELAEPVNAKIPPNATGADALEMMREHRIGAIPVMLEDQLLGIVTASDINRVPREELNRTFITALMTRSDALTTVLPDAAASDVLRLLGESTHNQVPVIDAGGQFGGFVTRQSILRWVTFDRDPRVAEVHAKRP